MAEEPNGSSKNKHKSLKITKEIIKKKCKGFEFGASEKVPSEGGGNKVSSRSPESVESASGGGGGGGRRRRRMRRRRT